MPQIRIKFEKISNVYRPLPVAFINCRYII
jgi:hypothetical protein